MKKILLGLGLVLLAANVTACQRKVVEEATSSVIQVQGEQQEVGNAEEVASPDEQTLDVGDLTYMYTNSELGYSINVLGYSHHDVAGGTYAQDATDDELMYVVSYVGDRAGFEWQNEIVDISKYQDSTDIFDMLISCANNHLFLGDTMSYEVEELFTEEINGIEMTKFEGTITVIKAITEKVYEYPVVAYGIAADVAPVLLCCIDQSEDQSQHELWIDKIDLAVSTFNDAE